MPKQTIGEFLATQRKAKGYTQQYVADMLGISNRTLSAWETNKAYPDILTLPALAELYGVTADEIIRGERNTNATVNETELSEKSQAKLYKNKLAKNSIKCTVLLSVGICAAIAFWAGIALINTILWLAILLCIIGVCGAIVVFILIASFIKSFLQSFSDNEDLTATDKNYILCVTKQYLKVTNVAVMVWIAVGCIFLPLALIFSSIAASILLAVLGIITVIIVAILIASNCYKIRTLKKYGTVDQYIKSSYNAKLLALCLLCLLPLCAYIALLISCGLVKLNDGYFTLPVFAHVILALASAASLAAGAAIFFIKRKKYKITL